MIGWWPLWGAACAGLAWLTVRALHEAEETIHAALADDGHNVGPDALQLLEDLDAHLDQYLVDHPDVAAGFGRLRQAIHEHREEDTP